AHRRLAGKAPLAAAETIVWLAAALAGVAGLALLLVDGRPLQRGAASRRQPDTVGTGADVPAGNLRCGRRPTEVRRLDRGGGGAAYRNERDRSPCEITHRHASPRRSPPRSRPGPRCSGRWRCCRAPR